MKYLEWFELRARHKACLFLREVFGLFGDGPTKRKNGDGDGVAKGLMAREAMAISDRNGILKICDFGLARHFGQLGCSEFGPIWACSS